MCEAAGSTGHGVRSQCCRSVRCWWGSMSRASLLLLCPHQILLRCCLSSSTVRLHARPRTRVTKKAPIPGLQAYIGALLRQKLSCLFLSQRAHAARQDSSFYINDWWKNGAKRFKATERQFTLIHARNTIRGRCQLVATVTARAQNQGGQMMALDIGTLLFEGFYSSEWNFWKGR